LASETLSTIRELTEAELPQLNKLVSDAFGYVSPHVFFDDFPIWKSELVKRYGIFSGEQLVSHVGIRFCEMRVEGEANISVAMVGAVATEESFRGQGLSSQLLTHACNISEEHDCDWTILWGSEHDFYAKFGFELQGEQFQASLAELENLPENKIPRVKRGWHPKIFDELMRSPNGIALTEKDRIWISEHKTVNWFYHEEPFAFVGFERGLDLNRIIHEYGGNDSSLREVLAYLLSLDLSAMVLGNRETLASLGFSEDDFIEEYLCLARPHSKKADLFWSSDYWVSGLSAC